MLITNIEHYKATHICVLEAYMFNNLSSLRVVVWIFRTAVYVTVYHLILFAHYLAFVC